MRKIFIAISSCCLGACGATGDEPSQVNTVSYGTDEAADLQLIFYDRKKPQEGEILTPPTLRRLSGILQIKNECLALSNAEGDHPLAFERGSAEFDADLQTLISGETRILVGQQISVGGPFNQADESFDRSLIEERCASGNIWLVTGTDVSGQA